jgi:hypothetical protein
MIKETMSSGTSDDNEMNLKAMLAYMLDDDTAFSDRHATRLKWCNRIMKLPMEKLKEEATPAEGEEEHLVLNDAAGAFHLPLAAIDRLCDAVGVDSVNREGYTAVMCAAGNGFYDVVEFLARNKKADLSIMSRTNRNVYTLVGEGKDLSLSLS